MPLGVGKGGAGVAVGDGSSVAVGRGVLLGTAVGVSVGMAVGVLVWVAVGARVGVSWAVAVWPGVWDGVMVTKAWAGTLFVAGGDTAVTEVVRP